jgi:hypothetical protein
MTARIVLSLAYAVGLAVAPLGAADKFGSGVSLTEATPIARILEKPADFEGKTVRVDGVVTAVCEHMGCWMALVPANAPDGATLMIKVDDGVIVFPVSAKGRRAAAQGVIQRVGGDPEGQSAAAEHAKATGKAAPAAPVSYQLKATGAEVF